MGFVGFGKRSLNRPVLFELLRNVPWPRLGLFIDGKYDKLSSFSTRCSSKINDSMNENFSTYFRRLFEELNNYVNLNWNDRLNYFHLMAWPVVNVNPKNRAVLFLNSIEIIIQFTSIWGKWVDDGWLCWSDRLEKRESV